MKVTPQPKVIAKGLVIFAQILDRNIKKTNMTSIFKNVLM